MLLGDGPALAYDVLVVATGASLVPEETEGLCGPGWMGKVFTFYTAEGAAALHEALGRVRRGPARGQRRRHAHQVPGRAPGVLLPRRLVLHERGVRDRVELTYVTPLDGAFTKPVASAALGGMLEEKGIGLVTEFNTGEVDGAGRAASCPTTSREVEFDLAVVVPLHSGAAYVGRSPGLGDELSFVPTDEHTLQSKARPNVFAIGDAANLPASKAGSVTHFEGEVLVENIRRFLAGEAARRQLRRPRELLHRDRLPQGAAHRLQLRHRAAARPLSRAPSACRCSRSRA